MRIRNLQEMKARGPPRYRSLPLLQIAKAQPSVTLAWLVGAPTEIPWRNRSRLLPKAQTVAPGRGFGRVTR